MAVDGHLLMERHTTTNQRKVSVIGVFFGSGGAISRRFGRQMRRQKNKINKSVRGLSEPLDDDFTQQPIKNTIGTSEGVSYRTRDLTGT